MIKIICRSNKNIKKTKIPGYPLLVTLHATCALTKSVRGIVLVNPRPQDYERS